MSQGQFLDPDDPVHISTHYLRPNPRWSREGADIYPRQYFPWGQIPPFGRSNKLKYDQDKLTSVVSNQAICLLFVCLSVCHFKTQQELPDYIWKLLM